MGTQVTYGAGSPASVRRLLSAASRPERSRKAPKCRRAAGKAPTRASHMLSLLSSPGGLLVAPHAKTSHLSRRAANAPSMVSSWYDSGLRLDGSVAKIQMSADIDDGSAAALEALDALEARLDAISDAAALEAETNFYSFLNAEVMAQG